MRYSLLAAIAITAAGLAGLNQSAHATVIVQAQSAVGANSAPFTLLAPTDPVTGATGVEGSTTLSNGYVVTFANINNAPYSGVYNGNTTLNGNIVAASPYNRTNLKSTNYLVAEPNDSVIIGLGGYTTSFDLLWGTVDDYNNLTITLCDTSTKTCTPDTITGTMVAAAAGISSNGTAPAFVEISNQGTDADFNQVILTSGNEAFEFVVGVPEPFSLAILGTGMAGLGLVRRRRLSVTR